MKYTILSLSSLLLLASFAAEIDPAAYGFSPDASPETNAKALQKALDGGHRTVRVTTPGIYNLDRPVFIDDATDISFGPGIVLQKATRYSNVLVNRGAWLGTTNSDITVRGLYIRVNGMDNPPPLESKAAGLRGHFAFYHINRLRVFDYRILDVMGCQYAFHIADFDDVILDGFDVRGNKDGIHINAGRRFVVRNGITCTGDDGVALNASDWPSSAPCVGTIEDGVIENIVDLPGGRCNFARVLTGGIPEWRKGIVLQRGEAVRHGQNVYFTWMPVGTNTYVSTMPPTHTQGIWADPNGLKFLYAQSNGCRQSSIRNVIFRNLSLQAGRGFSCSWDRGGWARSMHPEVPDEDVPVTQITIDGAVSTGGWIVSGNSSCDVILRGLRHPGGAPIVSLKGYEDRRMKNRLIMSDCIFGDKDATVTYYGSHTTAEVAVRNCLTDAKIVVRGVDGAKVIEK